MKLRRTSKRFTLELYTDIKHQYRWRVRAVNHRIVADSGEAYVNRADRDEIAYSLFPNLPVKAL
jgi:hypothetical protein